jgi:hypothetical protein
LELWARLSAFALAPVSAVQQVVRPEVLLRARSEFVVL